ncbi:hypothetical protein [Archangium sp.]|uniref:hypothetical protein n=1 Tax=Archangium sp. TaxID=1872627 RepID=UPI002D27B7F7|nr:hypothetical protein [Archangium sp.]HYO56585.1 hypothetical protein [Archangium sp.]
MTGDKPYHDSRRHLLSGGGTFEKILHNLQEVAEAVPQLRLNIRVNIDHRNQNHIQSLVDRLHDAGLAGRQTFRLYFAPVEAMTVGCHSVEGMCMSKQDYGQLEAGLHRYAFDKGLTSLPYPPRFHGTCGAVRPTGFVVIPTGAIHKCWDTVTLPQYAVGSIFDMEATVRSEQSAR